ncbi:MAG: UMP kinase [Candidatus Aenigmatarchaeota archaeon]
MKVVISLGGSLLTKDLSSENFRKYASVILRLWGEGHKLIVVCGGGKVCRDYRDVAKGFGASNNDLDFIGIMATHINASTFYTALGDCAYLVRWKSLEEAKDEVAENFEEKIIVAAGYDVGTSSDYDATAFADLVGADMIINATNVDGVYSADPKKDPIARKYDKVSYDDFEKIIMQNEQAPGEYRFFDLESTRLIKSRRIKAVFINGNDPEEIARAVQGTHHGTTVG